MGNYEYIIASLPVLSREQEEGGADWDGTIAFIKSQCSPSDRMLVDQMLRGFDEKALGEAFYREAMGERRVSEDRFSPFKGDPQPPRNAFIRDWFTFDLLVRNEKVRFLNRSLGRSEDQDIFLEPEADFPERDKVRQVLGLGDILQREKGLDELMWNKAAELVLMHNFDVDVVLSFIARLHIIQRWRALDPETGARLFRTLVEEVRGTFKGVDFKE